MNFYSQQGEDLFIYLNYINQRRDDGVYIEMGACDGVSVFEYIIFSRTIRIYWNFNRTCQGNVRLTRSKQKGM